MLRFALRSLLARKTRLAMSTLAIVLGVAFLAGVLTFSHGLRSTFDGIVEGSTPDAMVQVSGLDTTRGPEPTAGRLSPADVARIAALPQVAAADGSVNGYGVSLLDTRDKLVGGQGAPTLAFNHTPTRNLLGDPIMVLRHGRWATRPSEVVMDQRAADKAGYAVGDRVTLITPTRPPVRRFTLVGTATFSGGGTAGAILLIFDTRGAQRLFTDGQDAFTAINLTAAPGVSQQQLVAAVRPLIPTGFVARPGDAIVKDTEDTISSILGVISTFLLVFAGIAVLVCALIILNTFTILVAQRTRELAVVRALGASRRQITVSVLLEATVMALVATALGIAAGWALARALASAFRSLGLDIATDSLTLTTSAVVACVVVGVLVTALAAYLPARRAGRVAPVAAMRADAAPPTSLRRRVYVGLPLLAVGAVCVAAGLLGAPGNGTAWIGAGAVVWILTTAALSGVLGRPLLLLFTAVFARLFGAPGRLAGENALRDPRRTGATAAALMVGLALVSTIGVLASSLNATVTDSVDEEFSADFVVQGPNLIAYPTAIGDRLATVPGVGVLSRQQVTAAKLDGTTVALAGIDDAWDRIYTLDMIAGRQQRRGAEALVLDGTATDHHWRVGSRFTLRFPAGRALTLTVSGIAKDTPVTAPINIPLGELAKVGITRQDSSLSILTAPGTDPAVLHQRLDAATASVPVVSVQDKAEFADSVRAQVDELLYLIYGLLALAVVIAVFGIVNTLGLSVIERTRELGLLRAIGVDRRQLGTIVTLESVAIATLGAVLGLVLGLVVGIALRQSLSTDIASLGLPLTQLLVFLAAAVVVGIAAAVAPAVRAGRLDVLQAIATE